MTKQRTDRLNSLLKGVISDVIRKEIRNPEISKLLTVTRVDITKDLRHAKVYISVIGTDEERERTILELQKSSGFIGKLSSKQVVIRFFPSLKFILDDSVDKHMRIEEILNEISAEKESREEHEQP